MGVGMISVARVFRGVILSSLPVEHRVVAEREREAGDVDLIIDGPDMTGSDRHPAPVNITIDQLGEGDGCTYWAKWSHDPTRQWQVRDPWSKLAAGLE